MKYAGKRACEGMPVVRIAVHRAWAPTNQPLLLVAATPTFFQPSGTQFEKRRFCGLSAFSRQNLRVLRNPEKFNLPSVLAYAFMPVG